MISSRWRIPVLPVLLFSVVARGADVSEYAVIRTDRSDGRYVSTRGVVQEMLRGEKPSLAFRPDFTHEAFVNWQDSVRRKLREVLAFPPDERRPSPKLLSREPRNGYSIEKWEFYPNRFAAVPFLMLVPDGVSPANPAPAVLCIPGTDRSKENLAGEPELHEAFARPHFEEKNHMALEYVRAGMIAVAVDNPGMAETSDLDRITGQRYQCSGDVNTFAHNLLNLGWSYMGYAAHQDNELLKWIRTLPFVNPRKIATSGHSLGAWIAGYLAVLNPDVAAAVMNQNIYDWREAARVRTKPDAKGCRPRIYGVFFFIPGLYRYFDHPDIQAAIAPRPALYCEGLPERDLTGIYQPAYSVAGAPENLTVVPFDKYREPESRFSGSVPEGLSDDEYWKANSNDGPQHYFKAAVAVPWLKQVLQGIH